MCISLHIKATFHIVSCVFFMYMNCPCTMYNVQICMCVLLRLWAMGVNKWKIQYQYKLPRLTMNHQLYEIWNTHNPHTCTYSEHRTPNTEHQAIIECKPTGTAQRESRARMWKGSSGRIKCCRCIYSVSSLFFLLSWQVWKEIPSPISYTLYILYSSGYMLHFTCMLDYIVCPHV